MTREHVDTERPSGRGPGSTRPASALRRSTGRRLGCRRARRLALVVLLGGLTLSLASSASLADDAQPTREQDPSTAEAKVPERHPLGYLILGPQRYRDTGRQIGWVLTVGIVTAPITAPWYFGTLLIQGQEAARKMLEPSPGLAAGNGPSRSTLVPELDYGSYHALVIGINEYEEFGELQTAVYDATSVASLLREDYSFQVTELIDADRGMIISAFVALRKHLSDSDNLLIYYAGHGYIDPVTKEAYWFPTNGSVDDPTHWISNSTITTALKGIPAKHILVVADSCFSGSLAREAWITEGNLESLVR